MAVAERYSYAEHRMADAVFEVMAGPGTMKDRLLQAVVHIVSVLREEDFPEGELRQEFRRLMERILSAAPAQGPDGLYEAAFYRMEDQDARWILDRLHSLSFGMAQHVAARKQ